MNEFPPTGVSGESIGGVFVFHDANNQEQIFSYLPDQPVCALDTSSEPDTWIDVDDDAGRLYLKASLAASEEALASVRSKIMASGDVSGVTLRPGNIGSLSAWLEFSGDASDTMPITAVQLAAPFRCDVVRVISASRRDAVVAAIGGRRGELKVFYSAMLHLRGEATARIHGDLAEDINALIEWAKGSGRFIRRPRKITREVCVERLKESLAAKRLIATVESAPNTASEVGEEALQSLESQVVDQIFAALADGDKSAPVTRYPIDLTKTSPGSRDIKFSISADVADWFSGINGARHIRPASAPIVDPDSGNHGGHGGDTCELSLSVDPSRLLDRRGQPVITEVSVRVGEQTYTLRGPDFKAREMRSDHDAKTMTITVSYSQGGGFEHEVPYGGGAVALGASLLGVQLVQVDASEILASEDATEAIIQVQYLPKSRGTRDQNTVRFQDPATQWEARWYLVTRSVDLAGSLKWSWTVTTATGRALKKSTSSTTNTTLVLEP